MRGKPGYTALTGLKDAFGWSRKGPSGDTEIVLGGLQKNTGYVINGTEKIETDDSGSWHGRLQGAVPAYVARQANGELALYNEEKLERQAAVLIARRQLAQKKRTQPENIIEHAAEVKPAPDIAPVSYRARLNGRPVDALPERQWPAETQKMRPYFEKNRPVCLLPLPWRFVSVEGMGAPCYIGYRTQENRVCEIAWAVQARGAMLPPKGLEGYRYTRGANGAAYWLLTKSV